MRRVAPRTGRYWARRWHRWLGVVFVLPLLWLTVTGLGLRYAEELGMEEAMVESGWVLGKYGMFPEGEVRVSGEGKAEVSEWGEVLFFGGRMLDEVGELRGAVERDGGVVVATAEYLWVYDAGGEWEQKLGEESLPGVPVEGIGRTADGAAVVQVGGKGWKYDGELIAFEEVGEDSVEWSAVRVGGADAKKRLAEAVAGQAGIPWSRVLLDLHSGNLGGRGGKLVVDLSGLGIIVLTLMGLKLVFRKPRGNT